MALRGILRVENLLMVLLFGYFLIALYYNAFLMMRVVKGGRYKYRVTGLVVMIRGLVPLLLVTLYLY